MDSPAESPQKGHTRTRSAVKATRPRSSTKGPLDVDEISLTSPLSPQQQSPAMRSLPLGSGNPTGLKSPIPGSPLPRSAAASPAPASTSKRAPPRPKDFSFLLRPENYHPLNALNLPPAFRNPSAAPNQLSPDTPVQDLLSRGHFRAAAIAATQILTSTTPLSGSSSIPLIDPTDSARIFSLLYTRLACLTLLDLTSLAAQEVKVLEDLNSPFYLDETTGEHLVPWELRVLNVRLQAIGFGDPRRSVMAYYDLAREARAQLSLSMAKHDYSARELWKDRLQELGVKVAGALVEMDDLSGARVHLKSLEKTSRDGGKKTGLGMARALLWLHLGDVDAARECVLSSYSLDDAAEQEGIKEKVVLALCDMADGEYERALDRWFDLREESDDEMIGVNTAVCLLYVGRMQEGKELLEGLVDAGRSSRTLLFNLTTMYELCTEKARSLKTRLADKVAAMEDTPNGWERTNADFKL
ncbi:trafficking protein particle complex subunit-like protein [Naviculisporaceae sp. PSN 640]